MRDYRAGRAAPNVRRPAKDPDTEALPGPVSLMEMPRPEQIERISPDQVIEDILIATLIRVQQSSSAEIADAAARYLSVLR